MRISRAYELGLTQPSLDFVDVDLGTDTPLFIDPHGIHHLQTPWAQRCVHLLQHFFDTLLTAVRSGRSDRAQHLLGLLREPNETRLGFSQASPQGRGLGPRSATGLWQAISRSGAMQSGLLRDLEDTVLMVDGIGPDIVSDITTNIIREQLITYTHQACDFYGIPTVPAVDSGPLWHPTQESWVSRYERLPVHQNRKLLLVPKSIVRMRMEFNPGDYYRNYVLTHLQDSELSSNSDLVRLLKDGT